jgi:hypothetical protein
MSNALLTALINTTETVRSTPSYVLQLNAITRSIHNLSANAKKLSAMAMALLPFDLSSRSSTFTFPEFCKALGVEYGGNTKKVLLDAVKECMGCVISVELPNKNWHMYTWFSKADYNDKSGVCTMMFSEELAEVLLAFKKMYAKIKLNDLGRLQSKYAIRFFEIAMSYAFMKGKNGNSPDAWYYERTIQDLRKLFDLSNDTYQETREFRKFVVEKPVHEINNAGIGLEIKTESVKTGRKLTAIRFNCKKINRTIPVKRKSKKTAATTAQLELPELSPKTEHDREAKELEHLRDMYPEEFALLYAEELAKPHPIPPANGFRKIAAEAAAKTRLREKYGIVT